MSLGTAKCDCVDCCDPSLLISMEHVKQQGRMTAEEVWELVYSSDVTGRKT
jgi:hypothetical protein